MKHTTAGSSNRKSQTLNPQDNIQCNVQLQTILNHKH